MFRFPSCDGEVGGTSSVLGILGILIDAVTQELRLFMKKLEWIQDLVQTWLEKKRCTKRELLLVVGQVQHAATVVKPGRTFVSGS